MNNGRQRPGRRTGRPKGRRQNNSGITSLTRSLRDQNQVTRVTGRLTLDINSSVSAGVITITETNLVIANLGDRIVNIGDTFLYWRMVAMRYYQDLQPGAVTVGSGPQTQVAESIVHGAAFIPMSNANYAAPTLAVQLCDFPEYQQQSGLRKVRISTGKSGLIGSMMTKWLTVNTTSDSDKQSAGTLTTWSITSIAQSAASVTRGVLEFAIEFKEPIDTALIPSSNRRVERKFGEHLVSNRVTQISDGVVKTVVDNVKFTPAPPAQCAPKTDERKVENPLMDKTPVQAEWTLLV